MNVVEWAKFKLGYVEKGNNLTEFGEWYGLNGQPWCGIFVSWVYNMAGEGEKIASQTKKGFSSCDIGLKYFSKKNKLVPVGLAKAGNLVFFQFDNDAEPDHVGIVIDNDGKKFLWTIEGNTSGNQKGSQANGDGVYMKKRPYSLVMAVANL